MQNGKERHSKALPSPTTDHHFGLQSESFDYQEEHEAREAALKDGERSPMFRAFPYPATAVAAALGYRGPSSVSHAVRPVEAGSPTLQRAVRQLEAKLG